MWREYISHREVSIVAAVLVLAQIVRMMMMMMTHMTTAFSCHARIVSFRHRATFKTTSCVENSSSNNNVSLELEPWLRNIPIDYSAANEFIQAH
jgi:hypothetical protein